MPFYKFKCNSCEKDFEVLKKINEEKIIKNEVKSIKSEIVSKKYSIYENLV